MVNAAARKRGGPTLHLEAVSNRQSDTGDGGGDPAQTGMHSGGTNDGLRELCDDARNRDLAGSSYLCNRGGPLDYVHHSKCPLT
jgi:hypothetical protein